VAAAIPARHRLDEDLGYIPDERLEAFPTAERSVEELGER
jgi:hypothetical protein